MYADSVANNSRHSCPKMKYAAVASASSSSLPPSLSSLPLPLAALGQPEVRTVQPEVCNYRAVGAASSELHVELAPQKLPASLCRYKSRTYPASYSSPPSPPSALPYKLCLIYCGSRPTYMAPT